ncbi:hypothetical protein GCM10022218_16640 [Sphingobacterium ginsenosidimutans]|uniref:Uncharacterized protein n=1 Tax=Sphingobacterium ginsenosidimutans TaxID=687845 RepID=A0ABP7ZYP3_9SPHI
MLNYCLSQSISSAIGDNYNIETYDKNQVLPYSNAFNRCNDGDGAGSECK